MVDDGGDLTFDALCSNSGSDPSFPTSSDSKPPSDGENEGHLTHMTPAPGRADVSSHTDEMGRHGWQEP
jgi:hypothetical protein